MQPGRPAGLSASALQSGKAGLPSATTPTWSSWTSGRSHSVRNADQLSEAKYTLFDGMNVPFLIEAVMLRGNTVYSDGLVHETPVGVVL